MLPVSLNHQNSFSMESLNHTFDRYLEIIDDASLLIGEEKYNMLLIPFTGSINFINSIVRDFASKIVHFKSDMKRSQLKLHHDQYMLNCRKALNAHYVDIANLEIPFPSGMTGTYLETTQSIKHFFDFVSVSLFELYKQKMNILFRHLSVNNTISGFEVLPEMYHKGKTETDREERFKEMLKHFESNRLDKGEFNTKFKSIQEFQETDAILLSLDNAFTSINKIAILVKETTIVIDRIINYIKTTENPKAIVTEEFVKYFVEYVRSIAEAYDMYATALEITTSVEHNFVKILDIVYKVV